MARWTPKQILIGTIVAAAMLECLGWATGTFYNWILRDANFFGPPPTAVEVSVNTQFALIVSLMLVLNVAATVAFIFRSAGYGRLVLAAVEGCDIVATIVLTDVRGTSPLWTSVLIGAAPVLTLLLLAILWRASPQRA